MNVAINFGHDQQTTSGKKVKLLVKFCRVLFKNKMDMLLLKLKKRFKILMTLSIATLHSICT